MKRRAILINGGIPSDTLWQAFEGNMKLAYNALKFQGYSDDDIYMLNNGASLPNTDSSPTIANLRYAVQNWASLATSELVMYMIGKGRAGYFQVGQSEMLNIAELDQWLDRLQSALPITITVIADTDYSGSFIPMLTPASGKTRILIAGTSDNQQAVFPADGQLSFSKFFWDNILNGESVGKSFFKAKEAIGFFSQKSWSQAPRIDDNGNGRTNERSDGINAMSLIIGAGIRLSSDSPSIGAADYEIVYQNKGVYLYVTDINASDTTEKVWAVISQPFKNIDVSPILSVIPMSYNSQTKRYEGFYTQLPVSGVYIATLYRMNADGSMSTAKVLQILYEKGPDIYEYDDDQVNAGDIIINDDARQHNFHKPDDKDWLRFYAISGTVYSINIRQIGNDSSMRGELYNESNSLIDFRETSDAQREILWDWGSAGTGRYYLKLFPIHSGENTLYTIQIYRPVGPFTGVLNGIITDAVSKTPIAGVIITSSANASAISRPSGGYRINQELGNFTLTIEAPGYQSITIPISLENMTTVTLSWNFILNARYKLLYKDSPDKEFSSLDMGNHTELSGELPEGTILYVAVQAYNDTESSASYTKYISIPKSYLNIGHIGEDLKLNIPCAQYNGNQYQITLNYSDLLIWKIDSSSKQIEKSPIACLAVGNDLKLRLTAEYGGDKYSFVLNYVANPNDPFVWKMDTETLKKLSGK